MFYPYLLAASFRVLGFNFYPICFAQALAGGATALLLARVTALAVTGPAGAWAGLSAGALALFYGPFAFLEADLLMIAWTLLALALAAWLLLRVQRGVSRPVVAALAAGLAIGVAATERPNLLALIPAAALWLACFAPRTVRARTAAALVAGSLAVVSVVTAINFAVSGRFVLLTTSGGVNLYLGNHAGAAGIFDPPWAQTDPEFDRQHRDLEEASALLAGRAAGRPLDVVEQSHHWAAQAVAFWRERPGEAIALTGYKLALLWNAVEVPNHWSYEFLRSAAPALRFLPLGFGLIAPLGLASLLVPGARRRLGRPALLLVLGWLLVPMLTLVPFFVADRYRVVLVAPLIVLAASFLADSAACLRARAASRLLGRLALVAALAVVINWPLLAFSVARDRWLVAAAYETEGDLTAAQHWLELAAAEAPDNAEILNHLGLVRERLGDEAGAEADYRQAAALSPRFTAARVNRARLLRRHGALDQALSELASAQASAPGDANVLRELARLHLRRGETDEARVTALALRAKHPDDTVAAEVLAATGAAATPRP